MSDFIRRSCLPPAASARGLAVVTLALALARGVLGQSEGTVETLGGTGSPGYVDGVKGTSEFRNPSALALRGDGKLFIADTDNNVVRYLRLGDTKVTTFAPANRPVGVVFDSKTNLFIANQGNGTITKYDYYSNFRQTFSPALTAGPITALAIDRANNLYVAQQNGLVIRLNTNGVTDASFQAPGAGHEFRGVAVTDGGVLYVSDAAAHVIWRFSTNNAELFAGTLNQSGTAQGEVNFGRLNRPHQIAVGPNGSIVVADRGNHQVRVVSCEGIISVLYGIDSSRWFDIASPGVYPGWWDSTAEFAELREPVGIAVDKLGAVFDSEVYYDLIRGATALAFPLACASSGSSQSTNTPPRVVLNPSSGFYPDGVKITITASNSVSGFSRDTRLFYTLTGDAPTRTDTEIPILENGTAELFLAGPIDLAKLRVRAFIGETGGVITAAGPTQVPVPVLTPDSGYYPMGIDVEVTSTNGFAKGTILYYTIDGSLPTTNSPAVAHDGTRALIGWRDAKRDLRSLKVKAVLGPNQSDVVSGRAVSFPGEPEIQGEIGVPPARNGFRAGIGSYYVVPIVANLRNDQKLLSLQFVIELAALPGSPRLERTDLQILPMSTNDFIQVLPASTLPPDSTIAIARNGTNRLAIAYFGTNSGFNVTAGYATVALLGIQFRAQDSLGNAAEIGDGYTLHISQVTGTSDGVQTLLPLKPMEDRTIRFENIRFREGDSSPAYWYNAGDFGNGTLENGDVNNAIFAAFGFRRPFPLSDAFAAMDVYRIGVLENVVEYNDAATILRRALGFESSDFFRIRNDLGEWESSRNGAIRLARNSVRSLTTEAPAWHRDVTIVGGVVDRVTSIQSVPVPVYMKAGPGVSVGGMQFVADVVPVDGAPPISGGVVFEPSSGIAPPTMYGSTVPGIGTLPTTVYARWDNLPAGLTGTVLLGHIRFLTPSTMLTGQHYNINFRETGGAAIDWETGALTAYLFESIHGEVWPWIDHPAVPQVSDDWKVHFFGTNQGAAASPDDDADGDGFTNVEEYLAGSDPTATDWQVRVNDGHLAFRWVGRAGQSYSVEKTTDFKTWNAVTGRIAGQDAFLEYNELTSSGKAQFYRLNVH